ncbi:hypothetical protein Q8F55_001560 [Vanrija albida]|uniref:Uncharacterized protein n=1 Tax=Vanrija albida TaxID=181172 RepID=A0ABR3QH79_9TREE
MGIATSKLGDSNEADVRAQLMLPPPPVPVHQMGGGPSTASSRTAPALKPPVNPSDVAEAIGLLRLLARTDEFRPTPFCSTFVQLVAGEPSTLRGEDTPLALLRNYGIVTDKKDLDTLPLLWPRLLSAMDYGGSKYQYHDFFLLRGVRVSRCGREVCPPAPEQALRRTFMLEVTPRPGVTRLSALLELEFGRAERGACGHQHDTRTVLRARRLGLVLLRVKASPHALAVGDVDRGQGQRWVLLGCVLRHADGVHSVVTQVAGEWVHLVEGDEAVQVEGVAGAMQRAGGAAPAQVAVALFRCVQLDAPPAVILPPRDAAPSDSSVSGGLGGVPL